MSKLNFRGVDFDARFLECLAIGFGGGTRISCDGGGGDIVGGVDFDAGFLKCAAIGSGGGGENQGGGDDDGFDNCHSGYGGENPCGSDNSGFDNCGGDFLLMTLLIRYEYEIVSSNYQHIFIIPGVGENRVCMSSAIDISNKLLPDQLRQTALYLRHCTFHLVLRLRQ